MSSARHKTLRRNSGTAADMPPTDYSVNPALEDILNVDASFAFKKPWHRLERGLRLNRLRAFVESLATQRGFKETEQAALLALLTRALDRKVLNSKSAVTYDPEREQITEIKPLVMHQNAVGEVLFQILERRNAVTFRRKGATAAAAAPAATQEEA